MIIETETPEQIADACGREAAYNALIQSEQLSECDDVATARDNAEDDEPCEWDGYRDDVRAELLDAGYAWASAGRCDLDAVTEARFRGLCDRARAAYGAELARLLGEHAARLERAEKVT